LDVSAVIPAFNESGALAGTLELVKRFVEGPRIRPVTSGPRGSGRDARLVEVVVVDDGSTDGTAEAAEKLDGGLVRVLRHVTNRGKGAAARTGVLAARGDVIVLTDADGNYLHNPGSPYLDALRDGADIVLASRVHPDSSCEVARCATWYHRRRRLMGRVFSVLVRAAAGLRLRDTQTGLKLFRSDIARELFSELALDGFAFDVELLCRARARGLRIVELPLVYTCGSVETKVTHLDPVRMALDVLRTRRLRWLRRECRRRVPSQTGTRSRESD
jgi:dolichyl-phosphate beta-glucosyltransferase